MVVDPAAVDVDLTAEQVATEQVVDHQRGDPALPASRVARVPRGEVFGAQVSAPQDERIARSTSASDRMTVQARCPAPPASVPVAALEVERRGGECRDQGAEQDDHELHVDSLPSRTTDRSGTKPGSGVLIRMSGRGAQELESPATLPGLGSDSTAGSPCISTPDRWSLHPYRHVAHVTSTLPDRMAHRAPPPFVATSLDDCTERDPRAGDAADLR